MNKKVLIIALLFVSCVQARITPERTAEQTHIAEDNASELLASLKILEEKERQCEETFNNLKGDSSRLAAQLKAIRTKKKEIKIKLGIYEEKKKPKEWCGSKTKMIAIGTATVLATTLTGGASASVMVFCIKGSAAVTPTVMGIGGASGGWAGIRGIITSLSQKQKLEPSLIINQIPDAAINGATCGLVGVSNLKE